MGMSAKSQATSNLKNTVYNFKRMIGRRFNDPVVQYEKQFVPYQVVEGPNGQTGIKVREVN